MSVVSIVRKLIIKTSLLISSYWIWIRQTKRTAPDNNILILYDGALGDALIDAQSIDAMFKHYSGADAEVYFVSRATAWDMLKLVMDTSRVNYIQHEFGVESKSENEYSRVVSTYKKIANISFAQVVILFNDCIESYYVGIRANAKKRTAVYYSRSQRSFREKIKYSIITKRVREVVWVPKNMFHMTRSRELVRALGITDYPIMMTHIPVQGKNPYEGKKYITVAVDSMNAVRQWPADRFIELIHRLLDLSDSVIILVGNNVSEYASHKYSQEFGNTERVLFTFGKLTFLEWIEVIRGSAYHIGVDSGSIHVAASVGTQAFCLTGQWDGHKFFPYKIEKNNKETAAPICIYRSDVGEKDLACAMCKDFGGYGRGNSMCLSLCKRKQPCLCLERITVDDVMAAIEKAIQSEDR